MSTVLRAKGRGAKKLAAQKANQRNIKPEASYRTDVVQEIMQYLYNKQYKLWQKKLKDLSVENQQSYGNQVTYARYALIWGNKIYRPTDWTDRQSKEYCLPLNPKRPEFADRMREIAEELDDLDEEVYEVQRFLTNLFSFAAPPKRVKAILGPTLGRALEKAIDFYCSGLSDKDWTMNGNNEFAMKTFVDANKDTIVKMNQRVMINMTTL